MCCVYLNLLQKDTWTVAISFECLISCKKLRDIQMVLQLSECLSETKYMYVNKHVFQVWFYFYETQQSFWQG